MSSQEPISIQPQADKAESRRIAINWAIALVIIALLTWRFPGSARSLTVFILTLSVLVFVHEWGHFQFARWAGMKINRFAVGFPPWIYTKHKDGVDYSIGALPIGGMVDIAGLGSEEEMVATAKGELTENPTRPARRDVPFGEKLFHEAPLGWRFLTLFAGPLMNFIFAMVVFIGVYSCVGVPIFDVTSQIDAVTPNSPAAKAGVRAGDKVIGVDALRSEKNSDLVKAIHASGGKRPVTLVLMRDGREVKLSLLPIVDEMDSLDGKTEKRPMIGIAFHEFIKKYEKVSLIESAELGWLQSKTITQAIFGILGRAFTNNLSKSDKRNVGGPVKIAQVIGNQASKGWLPVFMLAAALSVNLGLMNLLPFPALDGGRILFLGYELVMRRPIDPRKEGLVHTVGIVLLLAFMLFITIHDVLPMFKG